MLVTEPERIPGVQVPAAEWFRPWRFAALLGLLLLACFPQLVTGFEALIYLDAGQFAYPVAYYHREAFWRGELPLWNPLSSCGIPFLAQWNTLTLYPLSLIYLLLPLPWSFGLFCLGHLFLAGLGMYWLACRWTGNRLAAAAAGAVFAFNGLTWYGLMWPHIIAALAWMPWVVLAVEKAWRQGGRNLPLAALVGALQMLSGGAEVILLTWLFLGGWGLVLLARGEIPRLVLALRALFLGGFVAGLAAVQLLPFLDLLAHSQRNAAYGDSGLAAMPASGWANYLVPLFHCSRNPQGVFVQLGQGWTGSYYLGVGIVFLALLALWRARATFQPAAPQAAAPSELRPPYLLWLLAAFALFGLWMALGSHGGLYDRLKHLVPLLGLIRFPVKFVVLATFTLPLLAAWGLSWLQELPAVRWATEWTKTKILALVLLGTIALILGVAWKYPLSADDVRATVVNAAMRALFLLLLLGCLYLLRRQPDPSRQRLWQTALIVLLWLDVFTHSSNLSPTVTSSVLQPEAIRHFFKWESELTPGVSRALQSKASFWRMLSAGSANPELDTNGRRLSFSLNYNLLDRVAKFDGFYSMDLKEFLEVFKRVYFTTNEAAPLKDFLGISHVSNPTNAVDWLPRNSNLPLITVGQRPSFASGPDTLQAVMSDQFEPLRTVYLPLEARSEVRVTGPTTARVLSSRFASHHVGMAVAAEAPAMVVVAQAFYHPWRAYVDGQPVPLWRANYAFQALEVPAGQHQVDLIYQDKAFRWGAAVSIMCLLVCGTMWGRGRAILARVDKA